MSDFICSFCAFGISVICRFKIQKIKFRAHLKLVMQKEYAFEFCHKMSLPFYKIQMKRTKLSCFKSPLLRIKSKWNIQSFSVSRICLSVQETWNSDGFPQMDPRHSGLPQFNTANLVAYIHDCVHHYSISLTLWPSSAWL